MRLILIGPPGAGKGTQATMLTEYFHIPHISTGDIFRGEIKGGTALGLKVKKFIDAGSMVPDDLTIRIVKKRLNYLDCTNGFLLDGFPRNTAQAAALDKILDDLQIKLNGVINIEVEEEKLLARITGRRVCSLCNEHYHQTFNPPEIEAVCDKCDGELYQRGDDTLEIVRKRLSLYHEQTEPVIEYYRKKGLLIGIKGDQKINKVLDDIFIALSKKR
jgi:adenylate kinase